jgi:hypothetical protein
MNIDLNYKLTANFTMREVLEWAHQHPMSAQDKAKSIELNHAHFTFDHAVNAVRIATKMQALRDKVNAAFPQYKGRIGFIVTSWFRPLEWETFRGRKGTSQHTTGHALDFTLSANVTGAERQTIWRWISDELKSHPGGVGRYKTFFHVDLGRVRSW